MRTKPTYRVAPPPVAPPPVAPPPQHCDVGVRFRDLPCPGGSDEDDRLSAMSWRSAASCSAASAVLERAQRRRERFWGGDDL
ncbi:Nuclear protein MDM1 [Liparis tanakae]|uniref:Nuclear protein MDM1 n=1 Tax=Liparis tanakae TaxID=230148 RepID=A0A4Z2EDI1_9TELE|nr:Nuclear protein MDM1 [Liparis tanakae]